jgi:probable selenium-dependent hydroxylase accessory protein YqeC
LEQSVIAYKIFEDLAEAIEIKPKDRCIAVIGAGGKTSLMYFLANILTQKGKSVICTTTTKIFPPCCQQSPKVIFLNDELSGLKEISSEIAMCRHLTVGKTIDSNSGKILGVSNDQILSLTQIADHVIIEADGASGKPIKAPAPYEPVIPGMASIVIAVIGLDALFQPVNSENLFRLENFMKVTNSSPGAMITPDVIGLLSRHPEGLLRNVPDRSTVRVFLNKTDKIADYKFVIESAMQILQNMGERITSVVAGTLSGTGRLFRRFERR